MASNTPHENPDSVQTSKEKLETIKEVVQEEAIDTKLILDSIPIGVCITDQEGNLINVNIAFTKLFGYTKEELIGKHFSHLVPERNRNSFSAFHKKWKSQPYEQQGRWRMVNKAGEEFNVLTTSTHQLEEGTGQPQRITFLVDVHDYEQVHLELQSTIDLLYQKLEAQEQAQQLSVHDLKNNVGSMVNIADILLHRHPTPEQERWLRMLMQVGNRTLRLLRASSDYYRMEQGNYAPKITTFDLAKTIGEVLEELQCVANQKSLTLTFIYEGSRTDPQAISIPVKADAYYMEQLFRNILQNALEASPDGAEVTVEVEKSNALVLKFHNQGMIPPDIQPQFFDKYATSGKERGTGLGTYLAKLIVELHEGSISYHTSEQEGTTIQINLPKQVMEGMKV